MLEIDLAVEMPSVCALYDASLTSVLIRPYSLPFYSHCFKRKII
jgi:hypothetical protein